MAHLFGSQMDYIFFFYGLAFLLMAQTCFGMSRDIREGFPWHWLGLFGITHGINEWLDLVALAFGDTHGFDLARTMVLCASFLFLAEFGRAGVKKLTGRGPGPWVHVALAAAALAGTAYGMPGLNAGVRYGIGIVGGAWAALALGLFSSGGRTRGGGWLAAAAALMSAYTLLAGAVVPESGFLAASWLNYRTFTAALGLPVQLLRGALAASIAVAIGVYSRTNCPSERLAGIRPAYGTCSMVPLMAVLAVLAAGWAFTQEMGLREEQESRQSLLARVRTAATAVDPSDVAMLKGDISDSNTPEFARIREQLIRVRSANRDCRFVYIMRLDGRGRLVFLADAEPENSTDYSPPGQVYPDATPQDIEDYKAARSLVSEPYEDSWGRWVSGVAPILDPGTGGVLAQIGMDVDAAYWTRHIMLSRLHGIAATLVFCVMALAVFTAWRRTREGYAQAAQLEVASAAVDNERRLRELTSSLGEGVLVLDAAGRLTFMNPEAQRLLGWRDSELAGKDAHDILHHHRVDGARAERTDCPTLRALATGRTMRTEDEYFTRKDGGRFAVQYTSAPILKEGVVQGVVVAFQDISERKAAEAALKRRERDYRTLAENLPGIVYRVTLGEKNTMSFFNDMVRPITGYSAHELSTDKFCSLESLMLPEDRGGVFKEINLAIVEDRPFEVEYRIRHKDGTLRHLIERGRPQKDEEGRPAFIDGVVLDATRAKLAEEELWKFKFIVDGAAEEIYLFDSDWRLAYANEAAARGLGYRRGGMAGLSIRDIDAGLDEAGLDEHTAQLRRGGVSLFETVHRTGDGRLVPKEVKAVRLEMGGLEYFCGFAFDITARKEEQRQKAEFLSMLSHDIKTPLSVIAGYAEMLATDFGDRVPADAAEMAEAIKRSTEGLHVLVDDFVAMSRLESGVVRPDTSGARVSDIMDEAGLAATALTAARGQNFTMAQDEGVPEVVRMDATYVLRALRNLLANASAYTREGGNVELRASVRREEGAGWLAFRVSDDGPGIAAHEREKVFEKYYRSARTSGVKGTGLGLAIVKAVAEAHGGRVELVSEEGKGSAFTLLIPL